MARRRSELEANGTQLAFVHQSDEAKAAEFFGRYGLADVERLSDPNAGLYRAFDLGRMKWAAMLDGRIWRRAKEAKKEGHSVGMLAGDGFRMPGVFLIHNGEIISEYRHETVADRPDYGAIASCAGECRVRPQ